MRKFKTRDKNSWRYGELQVIEPATGKSFTLTQPKKIFDEDLYHVKRAIAVQNVPAEQVAEKDFYVYEICYMPDGYCLCIVYVDEETAEKLIGDNLLAFLHGDANKAINVFFNMAEK